MFLINPPTEAMNSLTKTTIPQIDCQELSSLMTCAFDYGFAFGLGEEIELCNPIEGDVYYEDIISSLFIGREIVFKDKADNSHIRLSQNSILRAAFEFAQEFPDLYSDIGGSGGYIPQVGIRILLIALYGWPRFATDIGERFSNFIKLN